MDSLTTALQIYIRMTKRQWQLSILLFRVAIQAHDTTMLQLPRYMLVVAIHILEQVRNHQPIFKNIDNNDEASIVINAINKF